MQDKSKLSKNKYIYRLYVAGKVLHVEKYPIIYSNKSYTYYKMPTRDTLDSKATWTLVDSFEQTLSYNFIYALTNTEKFLSFAPSEDQLEELRANLGLVHKKSNMSRKEELEREISRAESIIIKAKNELAEM